MNSNDQNLSTPMPQPQGEGEYGPQRPDDAFVFDAATAEAAEGPVQERPSEDDAADVAEEGCGEEAGPQAGEADGKGGCEGGPAAAEAGYWDVPAAAGPGCGDVPAGSTCGCAGGSRVPEGYGPIGGSGSHGASGFADADGAAVAGGPSGANGFADAGASAGAAGAAGTGSCSYDGYPYGRNPRHHNVDLGKRGEDAACAFLERKGFEILARNYRCPAGEADIVAEYWQDCCREVHFIEVKTRSSTFSGFPEEAVDARKRDRYERISEIYLSNFGRGEARITFDIITILVTGEHSAYLRMHSNVLASDCVGR